MEYNHQADMRRLYGSDFVDASRGPIQPADDEHIARLEIEDEEDRERLNRYEEDDLFWDDEHSEEDPWTVPERRRGRYDMDEILPLYEDDEAIYEYEVWRQEEVNAEVVDMAVQMGFLPSEAEVEHMEEMAMIDENIQGLAATGSGVDMNSVDPIDLEEDGGVSPKITSVNPVQDESGDDDVEDAMLTGPDEDGEENWLT